MVWSGSSSSMLVALAVAALAALSSTSHRLVSSYSYPLINPRHGAPGGFVSVKNFERDSTYQSRVGKYDGEGRGVYGRGSYGTRKYDGRYPSSKKDVSPGVAAVLAAAEGGDKVGPGRSPAVKVDVSSGVTGGGIRPDVGSGVTGGGTRPDVGSGVTGGGDTGAGLDVTTEGGVVGEAEEGCRYYCRTPSGDTYCCESETDPITRPTVKGGVCPPAEGPCSFLAFVIPCSNDARCPDDDKCCFDSCQERHVCVPPSDF